MVSIFGSPGDIDSSFNSLVVRNKNIAPDPSYNSIKASAVQSDGKLIVVGNFDVYGSHGQNNIFRLNADGTFDSTFNPPQIDGAYFSNTNYLYKGTVWAVAVQTDGKIVIGGDFNLINGFSVKRLARLNADGTPDTAFNNSLSKNLTSWSGTIYNIQIQTDGKILIGGPVNYINQNNQTINQAVSRINTNGTHDTTFNSSNVWMTVRKIKPLSDGRIMVAGSSGMNFNYTGLARLNSDGSIDFTFSGVHAKLGEFSAGVIWDFEILSDGQIILVGNFSSINTFTQNSIAKVSSNGTLDLSFNQGNSGGSGIIQLIEPDGNGKYLIGGGFGSYNSISKNRLARINSDGSIDNSFSYIQPNSGYIYTSHIFPNGIIFIGGEIGWDNSAILDSSGAVQLPSSLIGTYGLVNHVLIQPDGKILIGGHFNSVNESVVTNRARLNADGTLDSTFDATDSGTHLINRMVLQSDGKILLATNPATKVVRLNSNGTRDLSFNPDVFSATLEDIAIDSNGKIIVVGSFRVAGDSQSITRRIVRFNPNGSVDTTFPFVNINNTIERVVIQLDGKILVAGYFTQINGNNYGRIARFNPDGTIDTTFISFGGANGAIVDMALQPDGKIIIVGGFTGLNGDLTKQKIGRLNGDGSLDTTFNQFSIEDLYSVILQNDGKVLIGGRMLTIGNLPRSGIARLNADGTVDTTFVVGSGTNRPVRSIALQSDNNIIVGGEFSRYNDNTKLSLMRLQNSNQIHQTLFDYDGDGKADVSVFRPSTNQWYEIFSSNASVGEQSFGVAGDISAPADYDGDGKTDLGIFRPTTGDWWYLSSVNNTQISTHWGATDDIPRPSDFDGDGKADLVVFRPSENNWYRLGSTGQVSIANFGLAGDKPVTGDFDGDGKSDLAVYRPTGGVWWYAASSAGGQFRAVQYGIATDTPVAADYDGDGKTDFAVYRATEGVWYILNSSAGNSSVVPFGFAEDKPVPADYDGDGKADIAQFRPSTGVWYLLRTTSGFASLQFGLSGDIPTENAYVP